MRLARQPADVSLADVYRAVGADDEEAGAAGVLAYNPNAPNRACAVNAAMPRVLAPVFAAVAAAVLDALEQRTLADLLADVHGPGSPPPRASRASGATRVLSAARRSGTS